MSTRSILARTGASLLALALAGSSHAIELRVVILEAQEGDARRYQGLVDYLGMRGITVRYLHVAGYRAAAELFDQARADAMLGGTGVACAMLVKGVAEPFVRPVFVEAPGVHSAVVVARQGGSPFDGTAAWFAGKRVVFTPLAASGEFFFRALGPSRASGIVTATTHAEALAILARGEADAAVVMNRAWSAAKAKYPQLEQVGQDEGANPDAPIVVASRLDPAITAALFQALTALEDDGSPEAVAAKNGLAIRGYVRATAKEFRHTMALVRRAGVTREFAYRF